MAWKEFYALKLGAQQARLSPVPTARAQQGWIRTAAMMRVLRLKLLAERDLLRGVPSASLGAVGRADEIRAFLQAEGLLDEREHEDL